MKFLHWSQSFAIRGILLGALLLASPSVLAKMTITEDQRTPQNSAPIFKLAGGSVNETCKACQEEQLTRFLKTSQTKLASANWNAENLSGGALFRLSGKVFEGTELTDSLALHVATNNLRPPRAGKGEKG